MALKLFNTNGGAVICTSVLPLGFCFHKEEDHDKTMDYQGEEVHIPSSDSAHTISLEIFDSAMRLFLVHTSRKERTQGTH
jgi:hypothetical protein